MIWPSQLDSSSPSSSSRDLFTFIDIERFTPVVALLCQRINEGLGPEYDVHVERWSCKFYDLRMLEYIKT